MWRPGALVFLLLLSTRALEEEAGVCAPGCTCGPGRLECPSAGVAGGAESLTFEGVPLGSALAATGPSPFRGLSALRRLALRNCQLSALLPRTFQPLRALRELDLSNNSLSAVPSRAFSECGELYKVVLSSNPLGSAPALRLPPLGWLELDNCSLIEVPDTAFAGTPALYYLSLKGNPQLETLPTEVFAPLVKLSHVHLEHSGIRTLPLHLFDDNPMLQTLYLSGNPLELPDEGPFLWSESLLILDLSACGLERLPPGVFARLPELRSLLLADNALTELQPGTFDRMPHLKILDLRNNKLTELRVGATLSVLRYKSDAQLDVSGNPASAQCACALLRCRVSQRRCFTAASGVRLDDDLCSEEDRARCLADVEKRAHSGRLGLPDNKDEDEDEDEDDYFPEFSPDEAPDVNTMLRPKAVPPPFAATTAAMHTKVAMGVGGALVVATLILATVCLARWLRGQRDADVNPEDAEAAAPMNSVTETQLGWSVVDPDAIQAINALEAAQAPGRSTARGPSSTPSPAAPTLSKPQRSRTSQRR